MTKIKNNIINFLKDNYQLLILSIIMGIIIHGYKIVNYFPTWDSMYFMKSTYLEMLTTGRWLSGLSSIFLTSSYDLHYVEGLFSIIIFSITSLLIIKILEIKERKSQIISIILFMSFPTIASTLCYINWAPSYALSYLMAVLSVYLSIHGNKNIFNKLLIILLICFSLGIYQIYITASSILYIYYYIKQLLKGKSIFDYKKDIISYTICCLIGIIIYFVILKIVLLLNNMTLGEYQGAASISKLSIINIILSLKKVLTAFIVFHTGGKKLSIYLIINLLVLTIIGISWLKYFVLNKQIKHKFQGIILLIITVLLTYSFLFLSNETYYHMIMQVGNIFIYLGTIMLLETTKKNKLSNYLFLSLCILSFYHFINDNVAYKAMEISYNKSYHQIETTVSKIDSLLTNKDDPIVIIGNCFTEDNFIQTTPSITGASSSSFIHYPFHFKAFAKYYFDRDYNIINNEPVINNIQIEEYISLEELANIDTYPYGNYVIKKDNLIVIKYPL